MKAQTTTKIPNQQKKKRYQPPSIIYESKITTRAGSPFIISDSPESDPSDLFGKDN